MIRTDLFYLLGISLLAIVFVASCDSNGSNGNDGGGGRPQPPIPCTNSECVAYCRRVGAETGTCSGDQCSCSGCDRELCIDYCLIWEDRRIPDDAACENGGCTCVPCERGSDCGNSEEWGWWCPPGWDCTEGRCYPPPLCNDAECSRCCENETRICETGVYGVCGSDNVCSCMCNEW